MKMKRRYTLADPEGGFWNLIDRAHQSIYGAERFEGLDAAADEWIELEPVQDDSRGKTDLNYVNWYHSDVEIVGIRFWRKPSLTPKEYHLRPEFCPSDTYPETLTPESYREQASDADGDRTVVAQMYERVAPEPGEAEPIVLEWEAPTVQLDGQPKPVYPSGTAWQAHLPLALENRHEFLHLFPGKLIKVRAAFIEALNEQTGFGITAYDQSSGWKVYKRTSTSTPQGGRRKPVVKVLTRELPIPKPPYEIAADTAHEAIAAYEGLLATALSICARPTHTCPTCDGKGYTIGAPA